MLSHGQASDVCEMEERSDIEYFGSMQSYKRRIDKLELVDPSCPWILVRGVIGANL